MARELRILAALWPTAVSVPEQIALCTDKNLPTKVQTIRRIGNPPEKERNRPWP
jgi:aminoglycoside phosphotransferase (APT) family kinase protein